MAASSLDSLFDGLDSLHETTLLPPALQANILVEKLTHRAVLSGLCTQIAAYIYLARRVLSTLFIHYGLMAGDVDAVSLRLASTQTLSIIGGGFVGNAIARYAISHNITELFAPGNITIGSRQPNKLDSLYRQQGVADINLISPFSFMPYKTTANVTTTVTSPIDADFLILACGPIHTGHAVQALRRLFSSVQRPYPPLLAAKVSSSQPSTREQSTQPPRSPVPVLISCVVGESHGRMLNIFDFLSPTSYPPPILVASVGAHIVRERINEFLVNAQQHSSTTEFTNDFIFTIGQEVVLSRLLTPSFPHSDVVRPEQEILHILDALYALILSCFDMDPISGYTSQGGYKAMTASERLCAVQCVLRVLCIPIMLDEERLYQTVWEYTRLHLNMVPNMCLDPLAYDQNVSQDFSSAGTTLQREKSKIEHPYAPTLTRYKAETNLMHWVYDNVCTAEQRKEIADTEDFLQLKSGLLNFHLDSILSSIYSQSDRSYERLKLLLFVLSSLMVTFTCQRIL